MVESSVLLCFWIVDQCDVIEGFKRNVMNIHVWNVKTFKNFKMADCFFPKTVCTQIFGSIIPRESGLDNNWVSCVVYVWPFGLLQPNMVAKDHKIPLSNSIKPDCVFPHIFFSKKKLDIYRLMLNLLSTFSRICRLVNYCDGQVFNVLQFNQEKSMA